MVEAARRIIRPLVLEHFDVDSCVATTRITIDVFRYFGIPAEPVAVQVVVFNEEAMELVRAGASALDVREAVFARSAAEPGGPWTLGVGVPQGDGEGGRHVAVWLPDQRMVADFSLDQASRPHKGLELTPLLFPVQAESSTLPEGFTFPAVISQQGGGAAYLEYRVVPDWFRHSPNWRRTSTGISGAPAMFKAITGTAIRAIKEEQA